MYSDESSIPDVEVIEDVNTVETLNKCSIILSFDLPKENETDETTNQSLSQHSKLSSLITKNLYYMNNPILAEIRDEIFNDTFVEFYAKLEQYSKICIDLLKIWVTEHDIVSYVYSLIYYTQSKKE